LHCRRRCPHCTLQRDGETVCVYHPKRCAPTSVLCRVDHRRLSTAGGAQFGRITAHCGPSAMAAGGVARVHERSHRNRLREILENRFWPFLREATLRLSMEWPPEPRHPRTVHGAPAEAFVQRATWQMLAQPWPRADAGPSGLCCAHARGGSVTAVGLRLAVRRLRRSASFHPP
jgi:hypothetical protein